MRPSKKYEKWISALETDLEEAGEWNGSSPGTSTRNIHEFEYITKMILILYTFMPPKIANEPLKIDLVHTSPDDQT